MADVGIILGSDSDLPKIKECFSILKEFSVDFEVIVSSAHRTPEQTLEWTTGAEARGLKVIIAAAGGAAHLPGVVAAHTVLPIIGIPIESAISGGLDSILSIIQMPTGVPVGAMPAGRAGGANAALYALAILGCSDPGMRQKLKEYRAKTAAKISAKNDSIREMGVEKYIKSIEVSK